MPDPIAIISAVGAVLTATGGFYVANSIRSKNRADAVESLTNSAMKLVEAKDKELEDEQKENATLRVYIAYLLTGIKVLDKQLHDECITPLFEPQSLDDYKQ